MRPRLAVLPPLLLLLAAPAAAANPNALWQIVHGKCEPDERSRGKPDPCAVVDEARGFAVLKDIRGPEQYLLIPTARITGIESPALLQADAPNYFDDAWSELSLVEARLHRTLPPEDLSLAVNSAYGRSQNQLHIHMECISPAAHAALAAARGGITGVWRALPGLLLGHHYRAIRIASLDRINPFRLLAASLHNPASEMGHHTLVLVGAGAPGPGFLLLDDRTSLLDLDAASGEELQDHACAIAGGG